MVTEFDRGLDVYEEAAAEFGSPRDIYWAMAMRCDTGDAARRPGRGRATRSGARCSGAASSNRARRARICCSDSSSASSRAASRRAAEPPLLQRRLFGVSRRRRTARGAHTPRAVRPTALRRSRGRRSVPTEPIFGVTSSGWPGSPCLPGSRRPPPTRELLDLCRVLLEPCADHVIVFGTGAAVLGPVHYWLGVVGPRSQAGSTTPSSTSGKRPRIARRIEAPYWIAQSEVGSSPHAAPPRPYGRRVGDRTARAGPRSPWHAPRATTV